MASLEEMIKILQPTGLYRLEEDSLVYRELQTYAAAIDRTAERAEEILRESMVQTACSYGLDSKEQLLGRCGEGLSVDERRRRIIHRLSAMPEGFNRGGVERALLSLGYNAEITEDAANETLIFEPLGENARAEDYLVLIDGIREILPVQLRFVFALPAPTWNELDAKDESFAAHDAAALPWDFYMD